MIVVPARTTAPRYPRHARPTASFFRTGPATPKAVPDIVVEIRKLFGKVPIFGICFGQQLLGLAYGGKHL